MLEQEFARREWNPADHNGLSREEFGNQFKPSQKELFDMLSNSVYQHYGYRSKKSFLRTIEAERLANLDAIEAKRRVAALESETVRVQSMESCWDSCGGETDAMAELLATLFVNSGRF